MKIQKESSLQEKLTRFSIKISGNHSLQALSSGVIMTLPVMLGASLFTIMAAFPVPSVKDWLASNGFTTNLEALVGGTLNILALLISFTVAYSYAKLKNTNAVVSGLFSLTSFAALMPQVFGAGKNEFRGLSANYLGNAGILIAILIGLLISHIYVRLVRSKKLTVKLPDSVPTMVTSSLEPVFIGMVIYLIVFIIRMLASLTPFENIFDLLNTVITLPLVNIGGSVPSILLIYTLANLLFFFGIHSSVLLSAMLPILMNMGIQNYNAFQAGHKMPYMAQMFVAGKVNLDGAGSTLALLLCILFFTKSQRYKSLSKLAIIPNLFNINEPVIFGMPIVYNFILMIPFVLSSFVSGGIAWLAVKIGIITTYNPAIGLALPWTTPKIIESFLSAGVRGLIVYLLGFIVMIAVYYPFVKKLDSLELLNEQENL